MWGELTEEIIWGILMQVVGTADGPRTIQAMLCVCWHWNTVVNSEIGRLNELALRMRREYAKAYLIRMQLKFPGTSLMLRAPRGMERAFRFHHVPRLIAPTELQLRVANYDADLTLAQRASLISLVSRAMMVLNHHRERWEKKVDAYGNAWFTVNKRVPLMRNSKQFRAGKNHSVTFVPSSIASDKMTDYVHGKRSLGRHRKRPVL
jgi:hypothetical protein